VNGGGGNDTITGSVGLAGVIKAELNGGDGNDAVTGTDGEDVVTGGSGNDTVLGARGDDDVRGDDGDDLLVWNPGEGTDKMEGGAGNDVVQDNGGGGPEHFIVSANGARVTATRDNVGAPFFLDIGTAETLDLNTNAGDDSVDVNNGLAALIRVDADLGDGNDSITARNDSAQAIDGGAGADSAQVDATDQTTGVETVDAPDVLAPQVAVASKQLRVRRGLARLAVTCPAGESACDGKATILYKGRKVGSVAVKLDGGKTKTYKLALKRSVRRALADAPGNRLGVKVKLRVKDDAGNIGTASKRLNLTR